MPLEIARTLASLPAEILRLRVDYSTSEAEVAEARRAWFEAQAGIRELQAISIEGGDPMR